MKPQASLLVVPLVALTSGIVAGRLGAGLISGGMVLASAVVSFYFVSKSGLDPIRGYALNRWHYAWIFLLFAGVGIIDSSLTGAQDFGNDISHICFVEGRVSDKSINTSGDRCTIEIERGWDSVTNRMVRTPGLKIIASTQSTGPEIDDLVRIKSKLYPITDNENYFSSGYASRLKNNGILYRTYYEPENLSITGHKPTIVGKIREIREKIEISIENSGLSTSTTHFLISILLGDRDYLQEDLRQLFADGGVSHMLALSGMHVGIIAGIVLWLLIPLNIIRRYKLRLALTLVMILLYTLLTGMAPSTARAALMLGALTICVLLERKNNTLNALFFSAFIILLITPSALYDIGFQLSFMCVFSLIIFANEINPVVRSSHPFLFWVFGLIAASLVATIATWVVTAYYFGKVPLAFLGTNILFLPLLPIFLILSIFYLIFAAFGIRIGVLATILDSSLNQAKNILEWFTDSGRNAIDFHPTPISLVLWIIFVCLLAALILFKKKKILAWVTSIFLCAFIATLFIPNDDYVKEGLIVQRTAREIRILIRTDGKDEIIKPNPQSIGELNHNGEWFLTMDNTPASMTLIPDRHYKAIILGGNFKKDIKALSDSISTELIVTHPSMRKKREKEILHFADSLSIQRHSIREQGSWRYIQQAKNW